MRIRTAFIISFLVLCGRAAYAGDPVTFNNQVVRILQQHCQTCHRPGNIAPFSLLTYADAQTQAFAIMHAVQTGEMPPWKPVNSHGVFEGERGLSDQEIQTIAQWVADGVLEGAKSDLPEPIQFPDTWAAGNPDRVLQPSAPYSIETGSDDIYRCFPIALDSGADLYVRGYEVLPGSRQIVHHVLLFIDGGGQSVALDNADPGPGYTCFGGAGFLTGLGGLGGWAPGASTQMFPLGTGVRIPAGSRIVMQVHYSTAEAARAGPLPPDLTRLGLYLSPTPLEAISFLPVVNPFFVIPAGESHYQVKALLPITRTVELVQITPHMHLLGREITVEARFPNGDRRQLIRIDNWDFHWQAIYSYREPITLPAGTLIELTAYYDNSTGNPKNPSNPPVAVGWGERTIDEMCLTFISVKSPGLPKMNTVPFSMTERGGSSMLTQGSSGAMQVGYARVSSSAGAAPEGLAIFGYRQNGVLTSEAGVPASRPLTRGRIGVATENAVRSGLAIVNPSGNPAAVSFYFTDENGRDLGAGTAAIPANGQVAAFLDEPPFNGPRVFAGAFTFTSTSPVAVTALRGVVNERSEFLLTTLPVLDLNAAVPAGPLVFSHFADGGGWTSQIMLLNPTDRVISGVLRFADSSGQPAAVSLNGQSGNMSSYSIPPKSARQFVTSGSDAVVRSGPVWIVPSENSAPPDGSLVFSYRRANIRITEAGVSAMSAGTAFRVYVEASDLVQSGIAITNTTASPAKARLELIDLNGASVLATTVTLNGNSQLAKFLGEISGFEGLSLPFKGMLRITSASPIAIVGLRNRNNERGEFLMTTTPPIPEGASSASELFFPHFADGGGYTTQFVLFSGATGSSLSGAIRFLSQSGQPLALTVR